MGHSQFRCRTEAGVAGGSSRALPADDEQEHGATLLLLGKRAVLAHLFPSPLAAELDETERRPACDAARSARCSFDKRASNTGPGLTPDPDERQEPASAPSARSFSWRSGC